MMMMPQIAALVMLPLARRSCRLQQLARQAFADQRAGFADAEDRCKRTEARAAFLAEEHFVERLEPIAQRLEAVLLADSKHFVLDRLRVSDLGRQRIEAAREIFHCRAFFVGGGAEFL